ncbi:MAG: hypothetical protein FWC91_03920 [Defluviitaleaceae bacterium]|nr:hypothetical protein [Defluviitaleaceae bacterium]
MKITMLGTSGSGKTTFMGAMQNLFFKDNVNGYRLANRSSKYENGVFINKTFNATNDLYRRGKWPGGTGTSALMQLEFRHWDERLLDIDWIDYRGEAITELAEGIKKEGSSEILATLMFSDVILVFVDAAALNAIKNDFIARDYVGADAISELLSYIKAKRHIDVIFVLSKIDSSTISSKDLENLRMRVKKLYSNFMGSETSESYNSPIVEVGACNYGNVKTECEYIEELGYWTFEHKILSHNDLQPINVASTFALALLKCLESEINNKNTSANKIEQEVKNLEENFNGLKNFIDILCGSPKREYIFDMKKVILYSRDDIKKLEKHRPALEAIVKEKK